ncbi:hypothetical protein M1141_01925 [Candidatus Marsarchaeota archaeon]|nr:hypothetical protein [Candidatus Marsarchaeota archaeon]
MEYYDIVLGSCAFDEQTGKRLGFRKIFKVDPGQGRGIAYSSDKRAMHLVKDNEVSAVICADYRIDKKLIQLMRKRNAVLCIPLPSAKQRFALSKDLYRLQNLFSYAMKSKVRATFISLAQSREYMCSYMQLIEFAKFVGATEDYARLCISRFTAGVFGSEEKPENNM